MPPPASNYLLAHLVEPPGLSRAPAGFGGSTTVAAVDKMQLLRGEPTSITANVDRQELSVTLYSALGELDQAEERKTIDVTPEPES